MFKQTAAITTIAVLALTAAFVVAVAGIKNYFPASALDPDSAKSDSFRNSWYSGQLQAMSEPALGPVSGQRSYRFTWLRTFHHPVAIRVVAAGGSVTLSATELDGAGGYAPGKVFRRTSRNLTPSQLSELENSLQRSGFWQMPSHDKVQGLDGSEWIIEAATDRYHVVDRWTPQSGPIRELGEQFLSLAGWQYRPDEVY